MEFINSPIENHYQWLGLFLTTLGTLISFFVLWQTYALRKSFLSKIKLPEILKIVDQNREEFYAKLALNNLSIRNEINIIVETVRASLKQSAKNLSSDDKKEIKKFLKKYPQDLANLDQMWNYYTALVGLQTFLKQSLMDSRF
ncbi:hypothetical protein [Acinetobacter pragensis]|uniref:Uncharacterized protein n=1 Tax=Acinetobacter pragensis TaxID=1806892 RepID=A0A151Y0E6_9GAMM|nr:hypothetical protein [Acinetobacter pragensis]KYQ71508.1 hypothetical protein AZH43_14270 [Acinetobacter pragensis]